MSDEENMLMVEASLTLTSIVDGLDYMIHSDIYNKGVFYQSFFSLSTGIERLLKLIILYKYKEQNKIFPTNDILKKSGHNLYNMINDISPELLEDRIFEDVITLLSDFAEGSRYYNLDYLTNAKKIHMDPLKQWDSIGNHMLKYYKVNIKKIDNQQVFANICDEAMDIYYSGLDGSTINSMDVLLNEYKNRNIIQRCGVLTMYRIIKNLTKKLYQIEINNNFYPNLREYFTYFTGDIDYIDILTEQDFRGKIIDRSLYE